MEHSPRLSERPHYTKTAGGSWKKPSSLLKEAMIPSVRTEVSIDVGANEEAFYNTVRCAKWRRQK